MLEACREAVKEHFVPDLVRFYETGEQFHFEEKKKEGRGKAYFRTRSPTLKLKAIDQAPMIWSFANRKCAEGAFITFDDDGCTLHIIEMKKRMTQGTWAKAILQIKGMYLTSIAVSKLMGIEHFVDVVCYVAFSEDAMSPDLSADPIFLKSFVGEENPVGGDDEWTVERLPLPFGVTARLTKGLRNQNNGADADFGLV